jgi:CDP-paratose 2-epimerase
MKILITGICGFTGSCLAAALLEHRSGLEIFGIDNLVRPGSEQNREQLARLGVRVIHGDVRQASDVEALPAADWVIDAAANPSVLAGVDGKSSSRQLMEHNLIATLQVLEYCKRHQAGLLLVSSSRVYSIAALAALRMAVHDDGYRLDSSQTLPAGVSARGIAAGFSTTPPLSLYGSSKLASEILALEYGATFGFPVWINRCGVMAGAGQFGTAEQGIFSFWINAHLRRRPLRYIGFEGHGFQARDAFHPADLAALLLLQLECSRADGTRVYTVGGGSENCMSLAQLTRWCDRRFGAHPVAHDLRPRPFDIPWVAMDSSEVQKDFGWSLTQPIEAILEGIALHAERNPRWLEISGAA